MNGIRIGTFVTLGAGTGLALLLAGCGGGGNTPAGTGPDTATRAAVRAIFAHSMTSVAQSGAPADGLAGAANGSGGGSGLAFVGAFVRGAGGDGGLGGRVHRGVTRDEPVFYYDENMGLWMEVHSEPGKWLCLLYEDEARTKPAGSLEMVWPTGASFPQVWRCSYTFTAGVSAGTHGGYVVTFREDGSGETTYEDVQPDGSRTGGSATWSTDGEYVWGSEWSSPSGPSGSDRGVFHADGSGTAHSEESDGHSSDWVYNADGSGSGRVAGPEPGLPATVTWTAAGHVRIVYADGTVEEFDVWDGGGALQ